MGREQEPLLLPDLEAMAANERAERAKPALDMLTKAKGLKTVWKDLLKQRGDGLAADLLAAAVAAQTAVDVLVLPKELKKAAVLKLAASGPAAVEVSAVVQPLSTEAHEVAVLIAHLQVGQWEYRVFEKAIIVLIIVAPGCAARRGLGNGGALPGLGGHLRAPGRARTPAPATAAVLLPAAGAARLSGTRPAGAAAGRQCHVDGRAAVCTLLSPLATMLTLPPVSIPGHAITLNLSTDMWSTPHGPLTFDWTRP